MGPHRLETVFNPRSVAVVGAGPKPDSVGGRVFRNLAEGGFAGEVFPVNPKYEEVGGRACVASVADIEADVDLAIIAAPAAAVPDIVRSCGEKRIGGAVILSAGFGETGEAGLTLQRQVAEAARRADIRFIGPNCLGVMRPGIGLNATFLDTGAPNGRLALVSQSGALCTAIVDYAVPHGLGFSTIVSLGNAADIGFGGCLDYLASDPKSDAILLYVEGIRDASSFMSGLRVAARAKPVIVLKAGRHDASSKAASTHTGALIGSDDAFDAALERAGVVRAYNFGQLFAAAEILSSSRRVRGNRLAIVTNGGGTGVLAADRAGDVGVQLAGLSPETRSTLDALLPTYWSHGNPVDVLGDATADVYGKAVEACLADKENDGVLAMLTPQAMTEPVAVAEALIAATRSNPNKAVLGCFMGEVRVAPARQLLSQNGIPDFTTPERAVEAFSYLAHFDRNQKLLLQTPTPFSDGRRVPDVDGARMIIDSVLAQGRTMLSDTESKAVLSAFHIACNPTREAGSAAEALVAAETLGLPVVMKISSPDISHKSDVGGVRPGLMTAADVHATYDSMIADIRALRPDAEIRGVTIEPMITGNQYRSLLVGIKRDRVFGPVVSFGAGGTMTELIRDTAVALPPLNGVLAARLIDRTRVSRLLGPFRERPPVNRALVEEVLLRISEMACELPHIEELDINPLFVGEDRVVAVDARIKVSRPQVSLDPYAHMAVCPYPAHLTWHTILADGVRLTIRPIRPEDAAFEQDFVHRLSAEAKFFRFMQSVEELTPEMLARFTQIDYRREMALVAMVAEGGGQQQVGVARYAINPDGESCEFALVVSDDRRNRGIGSTLMKRLMEAARGQGLRSIEGDILAENHRMLDLMTALDFTVRADPDDSTVRRASRRL